MLNQNPLKCQNTIYITIYIYGHYFYFILNSIWNYKNEKGIRIFKTKCITSSNSSVTVYVLTMNTCRKKNSRYQIYFYLIIFIFYMNLKKVKHYFLTIIVMELTLIEQLLFLCLAKNKGNKYSQISKIR